MYILRTAPCFLSPSLNRCNGLQRSLIESICNIQLSDASWLQASLPINSGGLGIRSATTLPPSAYLASASSSALISQAILPAGMTPSLPTIQAQVLVKWGKWVEQSVNPPTGVAATKQKTWDSLVIESCFSRLLNQQTANPREKAQLQACSQKGSGAWLTTLPISSLGQRMCNATILIATSLRLGDHLCAPHDCTHCGRRVDKTGLHDWSCRRSKGRLPRHNKLNIIIKQSLTSANIPSVLEPQGLSCSDGKCPDGMTITHWAQGRLLPSPSGITHPGNFKGPSRVSYIVPRFSVCIQNFNSAAILGCCTLV